MNVAVVDAGRHSPHYTLKEEVAPTQRRTTVAWGDLSWGRAAPKQLCHHGQTALGSLEPPPLYGRQSSERPAPPRSAEGPRAAPHQRKDLLESELRLHRQCRRPGPHRVQGGSPD